MAVVAWRRLLLRASRALAEKGEAPALVAPDIDWGRIKAATIVYGPDQTWKEVAPLGEEGRHLPAVLA